MKKGAARRRKATPSGRKIRERKSARASRPASLASLGTGRAARAPAALSGILVVDFTRVLAGPLCTMLLADCGARVIKVEEPGRGDETRRWGPPFLDNESAYFLSVNRNKESITLNLKSAKGREMAKRLLRRADVIVENFRTPQRRQFGLEPAAVRRINPRAILCSFTGFESDSEEAELPGYDLLAQASAGLMWITGQADGPPSKIGVALADVLTGHYAFGAIGAALVAREKTGKGVALEVSIFGSTVASLVNVAQNFLVTGEEAKRHGNAHPSIVPYQAFDAADRLFVVAAATDRQFDLLCTKVLGKPEIAQDPRYDRNAERVRNRAALTELLQADFRARPAADWVRICRRAGVPAAVVAGVREAIAGSSLIQKTSHPSLGEISLIRNPVRWNSRSLEVRSAPPILGQHTEPILRELGYTAAQIRDLRSGGAS